MQMNMIEVSLAQRGSLPLPSAALVIDMRVYVLRLRILPAK